jgi:membrane protein
MSMFAVVKQTAKEFSEDKVPRLGAALAYYTIFSIAPLLLIAISIAGIIFGQRAAQGELLGQLRGVIGENAASMLQQMIANAAKPKTGTIATIVGIVTLLLGAAGVFGQLKDALNTIWDVEPKKGGGVWGMIKQRFLSMAMVLGIGFLLMVSLLIDAAISGAGKFLGNRLPGGQALWHGAELVVSFAVITVLFALIFRFLPDMKIAWRDVWLGAVITSLLFVIGKFALGLYLGKSSIGSSYGAAGSLVILLLWIYYSAQILLAGAEFTQVYANSRKPEKTLVEEPKPQPQPAVAPQPVAARTSPHTGVKVAAAGMAGVLLGLFAGVISGIVAVFKTGKKLIPH